MKNHHLNNGNFNSYSIVLDNDSALGNIQTTITDLYMRREFYLKNVILMAMVRYCKVGLLLLGGGARAACVVTSHRQTLTETKCMTLLVFQH